MVTGQSTPISTHPPKHRVVAAEDAALAHTEPQFHHHSSRDFESAFPKKSMTDEGLIPLPELQFEPPRRTYISSPVSPSCITSSSRQYTFCLRFWKTVLHLHPFRNVPGWQFLLPRNTIRPPGFRSDLNQGLLVPLLWLILVEGPLYLQLVTGEERLQNSSKLQVPPKPSLCTYNFKLGQK